MGITSWAAHLVGLMAVTLPVPLTWAIAETVGSIGVAIAMAASWVGLWLALRRRGVLAPLAGGAVQGLAVAGAHYAAMAGTFFVPLELDVDPGSPLLNQSLLAYLIAGGIVAVSVANLVFLGVIAMRRNRSAQSY